MKPHIRRLPPSGKSDGSGVISTEQDFARRLRHFMDERGMSNSDLARAVWGEVRNKRGYMEAKGRDRISTYLKGVLPQSRTLYQLADALGVEPGDLSPEHTRDALAWEPEQFSMSSAPGHPGKVSVYLDRILSMEAAVQIAQIVAAHDAPDQPTAGPTDVPETNDA